MYYKKIKSYYRNGHDKKKVVTNSASTRASSANSHRLSRDSKNILDNTSSSSCFTVFLIWYWCNLQSVWWEPLSLIMSAYRTNTSLQPCSVPSKKIDLEVPIFFQIIFSSPSLLYDSNLLWKKYDACPSCLTPARLR